MSNNLLCKALYNNQFYIENNNIFIDELFQLVEATIRSDNYIAITIFTPLNYFNTDQFTSHHSNIGKYFYNKQGEIIRFMLNAKNCIEIDEKHDKLRRAIFHKR